MKKLIFIVILFLFLLLFFYSRSYGEQEIIHPSLERSDYEVLMPKLIASGVNKKFAHQLLKDPRFLKLPRSLAKKKKEGEEEKKEVKKPEKIDYFSEKLGIFKTDSIERGKNYLKEHQLIFSKAEINFNVPREIVASIIRFESNLGEFLGKYPAISYLYRLKRFNLKNWAEEEMINFVWLCQKNGYDTLSIPGSWAGAFGLPQFMPSSFLAHALDGDGDGKIDIFLPPDSIISCANFLKNHGWENGDRKNKEKVIFRYNNDLGYVKAVIAYADMINKTFDPA